MAGETGCWIFARGVSIMRTMISVFGGLTGLVGGGGIRWRNKVVGQKLEVKMRKRFCTI